MYNAWLVLSWIWDHYLGIMVSTWILTRTEIQAHAARPTAVAQLTINIIPYITIKRIGLEKCGYKWISKQTYNDNLYGSQVTYPYLFFSNECLEECLSQCSLYGFLGWTTLSQNHSIQVYREHWCKPLNELYLIEIHHYNQKLWWMEH